nr:CBS domain-containing protein [Paracoccus saliphilus]
MALPHRHPSGCRACGHEINAGVNAARNLKSGRSAYHLGARHTKANSLCPTVLRHLERDTTRGRATSAKLRGSPDLKSVTAALEPLLITTSPTQHMVAEVSAGNWSRSRLLIGDPLAVTMPSRSRSDLRRKGRVNMIAGQARKGSRIVDRPEFSTKFSPLTSRGDRSVAEAVARMKERNYGCIVITDEANRVEGIVTERDIMFKLVAQNGDPTKVLLSEIMTRELRVAKETDNVIDWLRIMSNERFRRLPVVDAEGRLQALLTQGDFVSYTWPDLLYQASGLAKATIFGQLQYIVISFVAALVAVVALLSWG